MSLCIPLGVCEGKTVPVFTVSCVFTVWVHCGWVFPCLRSTLLCFSIKRSFGILMWFAIGLCCFQCFIIIEDFHILVWFAIGL